MGMSGASAPQALPSSTSDLTHCSTTLTGAPQQQQYGAQAGYGAPQQSAYGEPRKHGLSLTAREMIAKR